MNETLYTIDGAALARLRHRRNWTPELLGSYAHVNVNTILRLEDPENWRRKGMTSERAHKATQETLRRLARGLNVRPDVLSPDVPEPMPDPKAPAPAPGQPRKSELGNWSGHEHIRAVKHRRLELAAPDMEI